MRLKLLDSITIMQARSFTLLKKSPSHEVNAPISIMSVLSFLNLERSHFLKRASLYYHESKTQ